MIDFLLWLPLLSTPDNSVTAQTAEGLAATGTIGYIVLAIIVGPVILLTLAAMLDAPRTFRIPGLFIGSLVLLAGAIISGFAIIGVLLRFIIPQ